MALTAWFGIREQCGRTAPVFGDVRAFTERSEAEGRRPRLAARVRLVPGWGTRLEVTGPRGPVEGATVLGDGLPLGRTDHRGLADVEAVARQSGFSDADIAGAYDAACAAAFGRCAPRATRLY